jgi:hypothetical protein
MIRKKEEHPGPIVIDLTGPDGNAFTLIAKARSFAHQLKWDKESIDKMITEMMSGDYENLLQVFDNHFGSFVILER